MRYYSSTATAKTLSLGVSNSATAMTLSNLTNLPSSYPYTLVLDPDTINEEIVSVISLSAGTTVNITRGQDGSSAVAHNAGITVKHMITARDLQEPQNHAAASTGVHGIADTAALVLTGDARLSNARTPTAHSHAEADVTGLVADLATKAPIASPTFTGTVTVVSPTAAGSIGARQITMSTADPSGGADGDVWLKYV